MWGANWTKGRVIAQCDNEAVVAIINSRYSSDKYLMQMLRCLFFIEAQHQCHVEAIHIPGASNELADHLLRNNVNLFHSKSKTANHHPSYVICSFFPSTVATSSHSKLDWTQQFSIFVRKA